MNMPQRITARLGDDLNWWVESTDDAVPSPHNRGVLDPRQVAHLVQMLEEYGAYGYRPEQLANAFQAYRVDAEISEGTLRLATTEQSLFEERGELFALPVVGEEEDGSYFDLLDAISTARVRRLNATHQFVHNCTTDEMTEELDALDSGRYFSEDTIHTFDELNEILQWSPAEWEES